MESITLNTSAPVLKYLAPALMMGVATGVLIKFAFAHSPMANANHESFAAVRIACYAGLALITGIATLAALRLRRTNSNSVTITPTSIKMTFNGAVTSVPKSGITSIILTSDLVLIGAKSVELARMHANIDRASLTRALMAHGYPAPLSADPDDAAFVDVKSTMNELPSSVSRLLSVREELLRLSDSIQAEALRRRIVREGYNVRDRGRIGFVVRQEVRSNGIHHRSTGPVQPPLHIAA